MPSTKDSILAQSGSSQQPDSSHPPKAPSSSSTPPAAATAAASKPSKTPAVGQPRESEVPKRSLEGFEEAVAQSVTAICEVRCQFCFSIFIVSTVTPTILHSFCTQLQSFQ